MAKKLKWNIAKDLRVVAVMSSVICSTALCSGQAVKFDGIEYVGRWAGSDGARVATYGGSSVLFKFKNSTSLRVDLKVHLPSTASARSSKLYGRITVDGGAPLRIGLNPGMNPGYLLADGLSNGPHEIEHRYDHEPSFGALEIGAASLDPGGVWETFPDTRPIIEVIEDSDGTGICTLGPTSPATPQPLSTSEWSSQLLSWPALLESGLSVSGYRAIVVDLALSGSTTTTEAETYDKIAPKWNDNIFVEYSGGKKASVVLLWGGSNDKNIGGEMAHGSPVTYQNLSKFQRGIYDQIMKVVAINPDAELGLLEYDDPNVPQWRPAYIQVKALLPEKIQRHLHFLAVKDNPEDFNACDIAWKGHPNVSLQKSWTAQILRWIMAEHLLPPDRRQ